MFITADEARLTGLWFYGAKYYCENIDSYLINKENNITEKTKHWLDIYFAGVNPDFMPPLNPTGSDFRQKVWEILLKIPYGKTITYNEIAKEIAKQRNIKRMSAQAVGGAVGHNPISIIIPCHRVIGSNGSLTGYSGGIDKKIKLLNIEGHDFLN